MPVNTTYQSDQTTVLSNVSLISGNTLFGGGTVRALTVQPLSALDLVSGPGVISIATVANASGMTIGQLRLVFAASGVSLMYSSGASVYIINSATSGVQP